MREREQKIAEYRQRQPKAELERKWAKARGRHSNQFWAQECLDLAMVNGREIAESMKALFADGDDA